MKAIVCYLIIINIVTWFLYGLDKWKAKRGAWRIPERTLLLAALLGGSFGAFVAMLMFRHKTKKAKFLVCIPVFLAVQSILFAYYSLSLQRFW